MILLQFATSLHREMDVDAGKDLGHALGPLGLQAHLTVEHRLTSLPENVHHVIGGTPAHTQQQHFHGPDAEVAPATFRRPVHDHGVATAGLADEHRILDPFNPDFHCVNSRCLRPI